MREGGNRKSKMLNANCPPQAIRTGERCGEMGSVMSLLRVTTPEAFDLGAFTYFQKYEIYLLCCIF